MGSRAYRRNSRGQFAGSGGKVTMGKAGGYANAAHQANSQAAKASKKVRRALVKRRVKVAVMTGAAIALGVGAAGAISLGRR